jgi:hemerythrin superfamily protein
MDTLSKLSPTITNMIRMDHTHVMSTFHQYEIDTSPGTKEALVNSACIALEIHAQLEEEIFYPAMRSLGMDSAIDEKNVPEHQEMRQLIAQLRGMEATDSGYDDTFLSLIRVVMHHVADEETVLLPEAERLLPKDRLAQLGAEMTKRRLQLMRPRAGSMAYNMVRGMPAKSMLVAAGALLAGTYLVRKSMGGRFPARG